MARCGALLWVSLALTACESGGGSEPPIASGTPAVSSATSTNTAPMIAGSPASAVAVGATYLFTPTAGDSDGDPLVFGVDSKPSWATFDTATGQLSGTPAASDVRTYPGIVIRVTDGFATTALPAFDLVVTSPTVGNREPRISGTPPVSVVAGSAYAFTPTASDPDNNALAFTIRNRPPWASFDTTTGKLAGTPQVADAGSHSGIVISATDGQATVSLAAFDVIVTPPPLNRPPVISGVPSPTGAVGALYSFTPAASDADGNALRFSVINLPSWATFDAGTGTLRGVAVAGAFTNIAISVSDGQVSRALPPFSITIPVPNLPPVISGVPAPTVVAGELYSFTPSASDPNPGTTLTFSLNATPSWASFNTATGRFQGTPAAADVGSYTNLVISVSDGVAQRSLPAFAITVEAAATGSALLGWTPPTENMDGSLLTNLAGYKFYWGPSPDNYPNSLVEMNAGIASFLVEGLAPGTYYFVVTAINSSLVESPFSGTVSKTIP